MPKTIEAWLEYIQGLHAREIDLSLERVREVYNKLRPQGLDFKVVTVAGTNGKGSTCEILASIYRSADFKTGKYTSPHVLSYNERFEINRKQVSDVKLMEVMSRVESARAQIGLTFFEFGTLVAIELFADQRVDVAIMEVGLGGRLDAVNILDADVAVISSISIDHVDWLGNNINEIALEKIAITRPNHPCVVSLRNPPQVLLQYCNDNNVPVSQLGVDYDFNIRTKEWFWFGLEKKIESLQLPFRQSGVQLENATSAIMAVQLMQKKLFVDEEKIRQGIEKARLIARRQIVSKQPTIIVDVAHNQASISELVTFINDVPIEGKIYAICGMLKDKQIDVSLAPMLDLVDEWNFVTIHSSRGSRADDIESILDNLSSNLVSFCHQQAQDAYNQVTDKLKCEDVLLVFGSFFIVSDIMQLLKIDETHTDQRCI